jgi:hypothetical protein
MFYGNNGFNDLMMAMNFLDKASLFIKFRMAKNNPYKPTSTLTTKLNLQA